MVTKVSDIELKALLENEKKVVVDFFAEWCSPCKSMAPILDAFAKENTSLRVVKVDIDSDSEMASTLGVRGIPTIAVFHSGDLVGIKSGAMSKPSLSAFVEESLKA